MSRTLAYRQVEWKAACGLAAPQREWERPSCSTRSARLHPFRNQAGFSLVEVGIAMIVMLILTSWAVLNITGISPGIQANSALSQTVAQLRIGRDMAISQRRNIRLKFTSPNQIELVRLDMPAGTTMLNTLTLENHIEFRLFDDIPDTPDSFGNGSAVDFGGQGTLTFLSDGTLVDPNGNPLNGTVFVGLADHPETARAATIVGATGRVRGYRWTKNGWFH